MASPPLAVWLGVLYVGLLVAAVPLSVLARQFPGGTLFAFLLFLPFAGVGVLVAARQPRNPIGWLLLLGALVFTAGTDAGFYSVAAFRVGHHGLPLARLAVVLATGWVALVLLPLPIALFPDGRVPSARWRWTVWLYVTLAVAFVAVVGVTDISAFTDRRIRVDSSGELTKLGGSHGGAVVALLLLFAFVALGFSWVVRQLVAYRRSTGERRQQLKWLMSGGGVSLIGLVCSIVLSNPSNQHSAVLSAVSTVATFAIAALPIGIGVGILKYRLYEIDRLISRTISYLIITGLLAGVFVGIVLFATKVLPFSSPVAVAASTLAAAALFNPLRLRVQHQVDRRFNRSRYDAEAMVAAFSLRLREAVDLDTVRNELLAAARDAVQPAHTSLWIKPEASPTQP